MFPNLNRRDALRLFSGTALALLSGRFAPAETTASPATATPATPPDRFAALTPELTEGPYYIDLERIRRDITEGKPGLPLTMRVQVVHVKTGAPIPNAAVDIWHCDATGVYSGFDSHNMSPPPGGGGPGGPDGPPPMMDDDDFPGPPPGGGGPGHIHKPDNKLTFLRGVQITGDNGLTEIHTIYPGWYMGRATHIHVRVHLGGHTVDGRYQGGRIRHTGQIFLPEETTTAVYQLPDYAKDQHGRLLLAHDGIYRQGGSQSMAILTPIDFQKPALGYTSDTLLVIDPDAIPAVR